MAEILLSEAEKAFIHHGVQVKLNSVGLASKIFWSVILKSISSYKNKLSLLNKIQFLKYQRMIYDVMVEQGWIIAL
jgi:hypothetical protein